MVTLRDSLKDILISHGDHLGCHKEIIERATYLDGISESDIINTDPSTLQLSQLKRVIFELRKQVVEIESLIPANELLKLRALAAQFQKDAVEYWIYMDPAKDSTVDDYCNSILALRQYIYQMDCWRGHDM